MKPLLHMWWVTLLAQRMDLYFLVDDDDADHDVGGDVMLMIVVIVMMMNWRYSASPKNSVWRVF